MDDAVKAVPRHVDWRGTDLRGVSFKGGAMEHTDFRGADLRGVSFQNCNLRYSDLRGADCRGAFFAGANLYGCKMQGADCREADFRHADMRMCNLSGAYLEGAELSPPPKAFPCPSEIAASRSAGREDKPLEHNENLDHGPRAVKPESHKAGITALRLSGFLYFGCCLIQWRNARSTYSCGCKPSNSAKR